jgi:hypothetical protein
MELEDVAKELKISLHALTGIEVANTMKLCLTISSHTITTLVDTGSTHTFIRD